MGGRLEDLRVTSFAVRRLRDCEAKWVDPGANQVRRCEYGTSGGLLQGDVRYMSSVESEFTVPYTGPGTQIRTIS